MLSVGLYLHIKTSFKFRSKNPISEAREDTLG